ncbi:MAG: hypothetical protein ACFE8A_06045 [Candidatus Hodarchaeota archaeon]
MNDLKELILKAYKAIFEGKKSVSINDVEYPLKKFSSGLRYIDLLGYRFIEQNPKKQSQWAKKAREGHKIIWGFKGRQYIAQLFDGEFKDLRKKKS